MNPKFVNTIAMIPQSPPELPLDIIQVFDAYDGPRLYSARDAAGRLFVVLWVDDCSGEPVWLYLPVSPARLVSLESGEMDLRTGFFESESGVVFRVTHSVHCGTPVSHSLKSSSLAGDDLPEAGELLRSGESLTPPPK